MFVADERVSEYTCVCVCVYVTVEEDEHKEAKGDGHASREADGVR